MTRLIWDALGDRFYETGVDRGVLFVNDVGVVWNGLISVQEKASGGSPEPYYVDGFKYINLASATEFEATIEAYSCPDLFAGCDGLTQVLNGLYVTGQRRKEFSFAYRTLVGNDIDNTDLGYKIHLIYNALAAPSQRSNKTLSETPEPQTLSWELTTTPPSVAGYKPSAHWVVDTRKASPADITALEDMLYGTAVAAPDFPTVAELIAIFS